mgnify:CR=1 FL=1
MPWALCITTCEFWITLTHPNPPLPPHAFPYPLPQRLDLGQVVRRTGFHGTSPRYVARHAIKLLQLDPLDNGLVIAHLGNGGSATAVKNGASVDTTMGMTPLEGLVMGTRSGDVDFGHAVSGHRLDLSALGGIGLVETPTHFSPLHAGEHDQLLSLADLQCPRWSRPVSRVFRILAFPDPPSFPSSP